MKNLFKKKQLTNDVHQASSSSSSDREYNYKTPPQKSRSKQGGGGGGPLMMLTKTPPMSTPSPTSSSSSSSPSIQIQIISNVNTSTTQVSPNYPQYDNRSQYQQQQQQQQRTRTREINMSPELQLQQQVLYDGSTSASAITSSQSSLPTNTSSTTTTNNNHSTSNSSSSSNMFTSFINCASETVSDQYDYLTNVPSMMFDENTYGNGLDTIPEERVNMWGMAPFSDDDEEEDGSGSIEDRVLGKSDIECVLKDESHIPKNEDGTDIQQQIPPMSKTVVSEYTTNWQYCRPCDNTSDDHAMKRNIGTSRNDLNGRSTQQRQILNHGKKSKSFNNEHKNNNGKKKVLGRLFQRNHHNNNNNNKSSRSLSSTKTKSTKSRLTKPKKPKWKIAKDPESSRIYFYHTTTQEVSWTKPPNFQEWKATLDKASKKHYFYNVITKETTWTMPEQFELWKKVEKESVGIYYYNVLTREVRWEKPEVDGNGKSDSNGGIMSGTSMSNGVDVGRRESSADTNSAGKKVHDATKTTLVSNTTRTGTAANPTESNLLSSEHEKHDDTVSRASSNISGNSRRSRNSKSSENKTTDTTKTTIVQLSTDNSHNDQEDQIIIAQPKDRDDFSHHSSLKSEKSAASSSHNSEPGKIIRSTEHDILRRLLFTYCPGEKENNTLLLSKSHGNEEVIIKGLQSLIHETPFDELRLAIFSFVKETLKGMGEQPFDENKSLQKVTVERSDDYDKVNANVMSRDGLSLSNATYSINSKVLSTMTGKSAISNATQTVNNTTEARAKVIKHPYSFNPGKSTMSNSTRQVSNTKYPKTIGKNTMDKMSRQGLNADIERDVVVTTENKNGNDSGSYEDLTETEEEDILLQNTIHDDIIVDMSSLESLEKKSKRKKKKKEVALWQEAQEISEDNFKWGTDDLMQYTKASSKDRSSRSGGKKKKKKKSKSGNDSDESAYAADYDGSDDDYSFNDEALDDISALSDSLARASKKRQQKEKKKNAKKCATKKKHLQSNLLDTSNFDSVDTSWTSVSKFIAQVEDSIRPKSRSPNNSIGYEEIPRTKVRTAEDRRRMDNSSHSSWDDDTLSSNFCSDNEDHDPKRIR